mgnify:CR=1 FL=1
MGCYNYDNFSFCLYLWNCHNLNATSYNIIQQGEKKMKFYLKTSITIEKGYYVFVIRIGKRLFYFSYVRKIGFAFETLKVS